MFESIKNNMPYSSDDIVSGTPKEGDYDLQEFLLMEKQKAQLNAQIHEFNDICWEKCMDKPGTKIDTRTETCLNNCVDRFIDVSLLITNRFAQLLQKSAM
ncbi:Mitochondrial import inner membrane translocase subunit Tim8 [Zootermopsis nevadensis]|uniref:Mitochondrial import inner membrane translocase subunit n=1 Tax=Zootermopsis nevadensis TaxID=136037 RepID=A0A067R284_ZOONE|nr:Mitochondrial import inner membrane translocase subunit Tim8 [Zootermopsis nevadensis]